MKIIPILSQFKALNPTNNNTNFQYCSQPKFKNTLEQDTVSFTSTQNKKETDIKKNKVLESNSKIVSTKLCNEIAQEAMQPAKDIHSLLKREFKNLVATDKNPNAPIMPGNSGIKVRVKSPRSIRDKALSTKNLTKDEIKKIGDIIGARIVLRKCQPEDIDQVFKILGQMVTRGVINVKEVENHRLTSKDSYVTQKTLEEFEDTCAKAKQYPDIISKPIPSGYTAIHLTVELENGFIGEIQIMGRDMEHVKDVEDFYYKLNCIKNFDPKYKSIEKTMIEKIAQLSTFEKEALDKYIKDSYAHAREIPPKSSKTSTTTKDFLPWPYFLPEELSYTYLYAKKLECDKAAKKAIENKVAKKND